MMLMCNPLHNVLSVSKKHLGVHFTLLLHSFTFISSCIYLTYSSNSSAMEFALADLDAGGWVRGWSCWSRNSLQHI